MITPESKGIQALSNPDALSDDAPPRYVFEQAEKFPSNSAFIDKASQQWPTNFLLIRQRSAVKGSYVINPFLKIPPALLPPSLVPLALLPPSHKADKNLKLISRHGSIDVDVFLVSEARQESIAPTRATIDMKCDHGSLTARLWTEDIPSRSRFLLTASSPYAPVTIYLPDSFHGPLTVTSGRAAEFSDDLLRNIAMLKQQKNKKYCFVGDFSNWGSPEEPWMGDEAIIYSKHSKVTVKFAHEFDLRESQQMVQSKSFFSRVFSH